MKEIWKDIPGYEGQYQASTFGNIRKSETGRLLYQGAYETSGHKFYNRCGFAYKAHYVHRLIALTFIPNPENKLAVDHIDFNEQNNRVENLRWVTPMENTAHSKERLYLNGRHGEAHPRSILTDNQVIEVMALRAMGMRYTKIALIYGVDANTLSAIAYRLRKREKQQRSL